MKNKQLLYLAACNFIIWFIGLGLLPVLPLYAGRFGANATVAGLYLAFTYLAITAGTMIAGWLGGRLGNKRLLVASGLASIPALVLLGQATSLSQVILLTAFIWFCGGLSLSLVAVFTGLHADKQRRGKSFGLTWLAFPLAALAGSLSVGQLVAWQGYGLMFAALAAVCAGWPAASLLLRDKPVVPAAERVAAPGPQPLGNSFYLVLVIALLSGTAVYTSRLGLSLSMEAAHFSARAVASTGAVGGLVTIPVTLLLGALSDRLGRRHILVGGYVLAAVGALWLDVASQLWHFWLASVLLFAALCVNGAVLPALVTDLLAPAALNRGLPWLNSATRVGAMAGFAGAGYLMDALGGTGLYTVAAALSGLAAALVLLPLKPGQGGFRQPRPGGEATVIRP